MSRKKRSRKPQHQHQNKSKRPDPKKGHQRPKQKSCKAKTLWGTHKSTTIWVPQNHKTQG